jgi:hypothetical protein
MLALPPVAFGVAQLWPRNVAFNIHTDIAEEKPKDYF